MQHERASIQSIDDLNLPPDFPVSLKNKQIEKLKMEEGIFSDHSNFKIITEKLSKIKVENNGKHNELAVKRVENIPPPTPQFCLSQNIASNIFN